MELPRCQHITKIYFSFVAATLIVGFGKELCEPVGGLVVKTKVGVRKGCVGSSGSG